MTFDNVAIAFIKGNDYLFDNCYFFCIWVKMKPQIYFKNVDLFIIDWYVNTFQKFYYDFHKTFMNDCFLVYSLNLFIKLQWTTAFLND